MIKDLLITPYSDSNPWQAAVQFCQSHLNLNLTRLAWLVPRTEQIVDLREALCASCSNPSSQWTQSPIIVSADRLFEPRQQMAWLDFRLQVAKILREHASLVGILQTGESFWALVDEYCELALSCVAASDLPNVLQRYLQSVSLAGPEAGVVLSIAQIYRDSLIAQLPEGFKAEELSRFDELVWFDDGELRVHWWLETYVVSKDVLRLNIQISDTVDLNVCDLSLGQYLQAPDMEAAAHASALHIVEYVQKHPQSMLGVAVVDRALARRVHGLLQSAGVLVDDRTGWRLSTTRLAGWLDILLQAWWAQDFVRFLGAWSSSHSIVLQHCVAHSRWPELIRDLSSGRVSLKWHALQSHLLQMNTQDGGQLFDQENQPNVCLQEQGGDAQQVELESAFKFGSLNHLQQTQVLKNGLQAFDTLGHHPRPFFQWFVDILSLLEALHLTSVWMQDSAGEVMITVLRTAARSQIQTVIDAQDCWVLWRQLCEKQRFREQDIASFVRFMPLQSFRLKRFDHVVVLGCSQRHFAPSPPGLLPPAVAQELGVSDVWLKRRQQLACLSELVLSGQSFLLVHAAYQAGQAQPAVGWVRYWRLLQMQRKGAAKDNTANSWQQFVHWEQREVLAIVSSPLKVSYAKWPERLTVQACSDLAVCGLKFALSHLLKVEDVQPGVQLDRQKVLKGIWMHRVIEQFFKLKPPSILAGKSVWARQLLDLAHIQWQKLPMQQQVLLFEDYVQFERVSNELASLLFERAQAGWQVIVQEQHYERSLHMGSDRMLTIEGRIDQLQQSDQGLALIDIKTSSMDKLKKRAAFWTDYPQLPLYAWLVNQPVESLKYLVIGSKRADWVDLPQPMRMSMVKADPSSFSAILSVQAVIEAVEQRLLSALAHYFEQSHEFSPMPHDGCVHCSFAGVCRLSWQSEEIHQDLEAV